VHVLRVGTSNDFASDVPDEERGWHIASRMLAEASGLPVETVLKRAWPTAELADHVERWLGEYAPEMVVLHVNNFWYGHESAPLWFERKFGRAGNSMTSAGLRLGKTKLLADNRIGIATSRALTRVLPTATHFTVPQVARAMEAVIQRVLSKEGPLLVVRGNDHWERVPMSSKRANDRNIARNRAMSSAMSAVCERHHVPYVERPVVTEAEMRSQLSAARFHNSAEGERISGTVDGRAMVAAWLGATDAHTAAKIGARRPGNPP
jgi:hypothetical protein